jgi:DNA-directed RNA polymerase subunit M/transcription elongation factor TFIIS
MEGRNMVLCQACGTVIYYGKDRKNNPPRLCSNCELQNAAQLDLNPLQIVNQFYVENMKSEENKITRLSKQPSELEEPIETDLELPQRKRKIKRSI